MCEDVPDLTPREIDVVQLLCDGLKNQQIADELGVSHRTVHAHVASAMNKTGTRSRTQLAVLALRRGIVPLHVAAPQTCSCQLGISAN